MWVWDGRDWRIGIPPRQQPPGLFWFLTVPDALGDLMLMMLIGLIPFVGTMVVYGWYLAARDHMRSGYWVVPRATFDHLGRGVGPFVAQLLYGAYSAAVYLAIVVAFTAAILLHAPAIVSFLVWLAFIPAALALTLANGFIFGAMIAIADQDGIGAACNPLRTFDVAVANASASWRVFGWYLLGALIGIAIGVVIPFGGALVLPAAVLMAVPAQVEIAPRRV